MQSSIIGQSMPRSEQLISLLKSHVEGDEEHFLTVAMQMAAHEAKQGHSRLAGRLIDLVEGAKRKAAVIEPSTDAIPIARARGDLADLVSVTYPKSKLRNLIVNDDQQRRLRRIVQEQLQASKIEFHGFTPRKKILLVGPPGSGKTMTASALAGELRIPLFTILLEGLITKYLGETASKLRVVFDAMHRTRGLFLFDEFDAIGSKRTAKNDVGEIRRILNSFLTLLEKDQSASLVVCATNHPELLDLALFRRFDDVIEYELPSTTHIQKLLRGRLSSFEQSDVDWEHVAKEAQGLSQAEVVRAAEETGKALLLEGETRLTQRGLVAAISERKRASAIA